MLKLMRTGTGRMVRKAFSQSDTTGRTVARMMLAMDRRSAPDVLEDGGPGSGNFGHKGRPGLRGGSGEGGGGGFKGSSSGKTSPAVRKANQRSLSESNRKMSQTCRERAAQWPEGSGERHIYELYAGILSKPLDGRPTPEQSKALTDKFQSNISSQLKPYAVERYKRDLANEPQITSDLCDISEDLGVGMFGLGYRLKKASDSDDGGCRIAEKIQENIKEAEDRGEHISYEQATDQLSDMVRYTQACTADNLTDCFEATRSALEAKGYKTVKVKNTWDSYSINKAYRGVNCVFMSPTGTRFELQFHTAESLVGKEVQHGQYEEQRSPRTSESRKKELGQMMYNNMSSLSRPKGIERIKKYPPD